MAGNVLLLYLFNSNASGGAQMQFTASNCTKKCLQSMNLNGTFYLTTGTYSSSTLTAAGSYEIQYNPLTVYGALTGSNICSLFKNTTVGFGVNIQFITSGTNGTSKLLGIGNTGVFQFGYHTAPSVDNSYTLGTSGLRWSTIFGSALNLNGNTTISGTNSTVKFQVKNNATNIVTAVDTPNDKIFNYYKTEFSGATDPNKFVIKNNSGGGTTFF